MATLAEHDPVPPIPESKEHLPPILHRTSPAPNVFDGSIRLYICYKCPYSHRVFMARHFKGLQDRIELVPINSFNRPPWYKHKVNTEDKVPALEYKERIHTGSLDLLRYIERAFQGPALLPKKPSKRRFADEVLSNVDDYIKSINMSFRGEPEIELRDTFSNLERYLSKYKEEGPFFLGEFSLVDCAWAPFVYRYDIFLKNQWNIDVFRNKPRLTKWMEALNNQPCFRETKCDPKVVLDYYTRRYITLKFD